MMWERDDDVDDNNIMFRSREPIFFLTGSDRGSGWSIIFLKVV